MSLSIKVSQLTVLPEITADDYIIVNDSGSLTTERAPITSLQYFLANTTGSVSSASYANSASHANQSDSSSYAVSASIALSASYARSASYALSSSYSKSSSYADKAALADAVVGGSGFATNATSASYASSSLSSSYSVSSSYALSSSFARASLTTTSASYAVSSSLSTLAQQVQINGGEFVSNPTGRFNNPYNKWVTIWSGSYTGKLQRTSINDLGVQFNIGKPLVFLNVNEQNPSLDKDTGLTPLGQPYKELRDGNPFGVYGPWLIMSYIYSGGTIDPGTGTPNPTGSFVGYQNTDTLPPGTPYTRNLRVIPNGNIANNSLDETSIGSQTWTEYFRSSRYFAWYQGGSFFGHRSSELDPGISGSTVMVLAGARLGIGAFGSGSQRDVGTANPTPPIYPLAPLHISASEGAMNDTNTPLIRLDQKVGTAGTIGSLQGWIRVSINGVAYKMPLYN